MNHRFLPDIASKYGCGLVDVRSGWLEYLQDNHYEPGQLLLKDGAHLNAQGNFLIAHSPAVTWCTARTCRKPQWKDLTRAHPIAAGDWKDGKLTLEFEGNRVDLPVAGSGQTPGRHALGVPGRRQEAQ